MLSVFGEGKRGRHRLMEGKGGGAQTMSVCVRRRWSVGS
jgi:hypothetical protein